MLDIINCLYFQSIWLQFFQNIRNEPIDFTAVMEFLPSRRVYESLRKIRLVGSKRRSFMVSTEKKVFRSTPVIIIDNKNQNHRYQPCD